MALLMLSSDPVARLLHQHAIRPTPSRRLVLGVLRQSASALSAAEIERQLPFRLNRITLYRTLKTLAATALIHCVIDHSETIRYATCAGAAPSLPDHVHFKCTACQHIYCLEQVAVPAVELPGRYQTQRRDYLLSGVCAQCQLP